ncbi:interactor of HORMAD1 protein 1 [Sorex araneus]|uniref:interactor of HORMAD1 protein 1 n=1 Tax=Sorex araneus TaxID=42254 RepID=UPI0024337D41|nr:interactor of HORMAD1 protein 1 [Sorex araneus]
MNFNIWNIKDMFSIPSGAGTAKSSNWNSNQNDYSSLSDSQFLFGSQFCPESSDTQSAPLDFDVQLKNPKQSQQNSLDSEPSVFAKYQTKPHLFGGGGDSKDGTLFPLPVSVRKSKDLLKQFEEKKKRAEDKYDSETLYNFISHVRESIDRLQTTVEKSEECLSLRSQFIVDSLETVVKTLLETSRSQKDLLLERVKDTGNLEQAIIEIQKRFEAKQAEFVEMKTSLEHLEVLVIQQSKDLQQLGEQLSQLNIPGVLAEIKSLVSFPGVVTHVKDSTSQTSPLLAQSLSFTNQKVCAPEDSALQQAQVRPAVRKLSMGSPLPPSLSVWVEGAQHDTLQEEAELLASRAGKGKQEVKDQAVQTNSKNHPGTKASSENGSTDHTLPENSDLLSQGASPLTHLHLDRFATSTKNSSQKHHARDMFLYDPFEQRLVTTQKGRTRARVRKDKKQQLRKACRGRPRARKQEQIPSNTCAFSSKHPPPTDSVPQKAPHRQQEVFDLSTLEDPALGGSVSKTEEGDLLQASGHSCQDSSSQRDHHIHWFSDLNLSSSNSPKCREPGKILLYDLDFDSSDDGF